MFILQLSNKGHWYKFYQYTAEGGAIWAAQHWGAVINEHARVLDESGMVIYET